MLRALLFALLCSKLLANAAQFPVADAAAFATAVRKAAPGDDILMQSGEWRDADLLLRGEGTLEKPITLRAAKPGAVKLTGRSRLRIAGRHLVIEGLHFHDVSTSADAVISFREDSKKEASHCRLRECAITQSPDFKIAREQKWVALYGTGNRVERCHFEGKTSRGTLLVVWLPSRPGEPPRHRIDGNYFGPRPRLGRNEGEILRIGDSDTSMQDAGCLVEGNLFHRCDGEAECISNKSCANTYRANTFLECQGTLTLRHGNRCIVEANFFDGNHRKETGGIRVIGEDHRVLGNHLTALEGDGARGAICLMNGIEHSPPNGYFQVKRALIRDNTLLDCQHSIVIGFADSDVKATLPPIDCEFTGNHVSAHGRQLI
ncbi:MAG: polysaccharide lyase 6 family protein, partial [Chthoniobacteraceae bacterium]